MSDERFPADLVITKQDFADCGWKDVLARTTREGYSSMWQAFSAAARQANEEGQLSHGKVLWLLADACSMTLSPKSLNEPFKPIAVMEGKRSVIPDDLPEVDIAFFGQIVDDIDDFWLKARLADLVWLKQRPRDVRFALAAIDSYRSIPLDTKTWTRGGDKCWQRAISLARMLKDGAGDRIKEMETAITAAFQTASRADGFLALWLADLLDAHGLARDQTTTIAHRLDSLAREFDGEGDLHRAQRL